MGNELIATLQRVFPYRVKVAPRSDKTRSVWSTEKVHSIIHGARNIEQMGRSRNISCQPTECKLKDVKGKGHLTNKNPATYGFSIMNAEAREASGQQMAQDADELGAYIDNTYNTYEYVRIRTQYVRIRMCQKKYGCVRIRTYLRTYVRTYRTYRTYCVRIFCRNPVGVSNTYDTYGYVRYVRNTYAIRTQIRTNTYEYVRIRTSTRLQDFDRHNRIFFGHVRIRTYFCTYFVCIFKY